MIRIRCFSSFGHVDLEQYYMMSAHAEYGTKFTIVNDETYTHVIILNTAMPNIHHIPKKNVIGLAFEPHGNICRLCEKTHRYLLHRRIHRFTGSVHITLHVPDA